MPPPGTASSSLSDESDALRDLRIRVEALDLIVGCERCERKGAARGEDVDVDVDVVRLRFFWKKASGMVACWRVSFPPLPAVLLLRCYAVQES